MILPSTMFTAMECESCEEDEMLYMFYLSYLLTHLSLFFLFLAVAIGAKVRTNWNSMGMSSPVEERLAQARQFPSPHLQAVALRQTRLPRHHPIVTIY